MKFELPARSSGKSDKYIENLSSENIPPLVHLEIIKNKEILIDIEMTDTFYNEFEELHNSFDIVESALKRNIELEKALEIIKKKNVCIATLKDSDSLEEYNDVICYHKVRSRTFEKPTSLTQEEFDLVKEVLL